ncbi:MAG: DUF1330 domain-containing protein [Planctomycetota bacterium]|jgi:uncharacterized protein (DUF1330 family)
MAGYVIARVEVTDPERYKEYLKLTPATIAKFGGRFIARAGETLSLEGPEETRRVVILEFGSLEQAKQWYHSDDYQRVRKMRVGAAEADFLAIDGA